MMVVDQIKNSSAWAKVVVAVATWMTTLAIAVTSTAYWFGTDRSVAHERIRQNHQTICTHSSTLIDHNKRIRMLEEDRARLSTELDNLVKGFERDMARVHSQLDVMITTLRKNNGQ